MVDRKSKDAQLRLSWPKKFGVDLRGPGGVVILITWLLAVVGVAVWGNGIVQGTAFVLLACFIAAYFSVIGKY